MLGFESEGRPDEIHTQGETGTGQRLIETMGETFEQRPKKTRRCAHQNEDARGAGQRERRNVTSGDEAVEGETFRSVATPISLSLQR